MPNAVAIKFNVLGPGDVGWRINFANSDRKIGSFLVYCLDGFGERKGKEKEGMFAFSHFCQTRRCQLKNKVDHFAIYWSFAVNTAAI